MTIQDAERFEDVEFPEWIIKIEQYAANASIVRIFFFLFYIFIQRKS